MVERAELVGRAEALAEEKRDLAHRLEGARAETATVRAELATARERIVVLEREPSARRGAVVFPQAVDRNFLANLANPDERASEATVEVLRAEWKAVKERIPELQARQDRHGLAAAGARLLRIQNAFTALGEMPPA